MTEDAKKAAKVEKKLKILLGGYQVNSLSLDNGKILLCNCIYRRKLCFVSFY